MKYDRCEHNMLLLVCYCNSLLHCL